MKTEPRQKLIPASINKQEITRNKIIRCVQVECVYMIITYIVFYLVKQVKSEFTNCSCSLNCIV